MPSLLECLVCRCKVCAIDLRFTEDLGKVFNDHFTGDEHAANRAKIESLTKIYQPRMYSQVKYIVMYCESPTCDKLLKATTHRIPASQVILSTGFCILGMSS